MSTYSEEEKRRMVCGFSTCVNYRAAIEAENARLKESTKEDVFAMVDLQKEVKRLTALLAEAEGAKLALEDVMGVSCHVGSCQHCWFNKDCPDRLKLVYKATRSLQKLGPEQRNWSWVPNLEGMTFDKHFQDAVQKLRAWKVGE